MGLTMKAACERCGAGLSSGGPAFVCSYECTFCDACSAALARVCPNCDGELVRRPTRGVAAVVVRAAAPADAPRLEGWMASFNLEEGIAWDPALGAPALARLLADASLGVAALVERQGEAVGYAVVTWGYDLEWNGRDAFLTELWIEPASRGRGVGARALAGVEALARAAGARALHLMVRPDNLAAIALYARAGYAAPPRSLLTKPLAP